MASIKLAVPACFNKDFNKNSRACNSKPHNGICEICYTLNNLSKFYQCYMCPRVFMRSEDLENHYIAAHGDGGKVFTSKR